MGRLFNILKESILSKMKKSNSIFKKIKIVCIIFLTLICISLATFFTDSALIENNKSPIFSFPYAHMNDGGSVCYLGFGYQMIKWRKLTDNQQGYDVGVEKHYLVGINLYPETSNVILDRE